MLPRETSVRQLKKLRAETKGTDIGDLTTKDRLNMPVPNMQAIGNPVDTGIESWEDFSNKDSKLQTIAFKSKLVNKPLVKENKKETENMKENIQKFEDFNEFKMNYIKPMPSDIKYTQDKNYFEDDEDEYKYVNNDDDDDDDDYHYFIQGKDRKKIIRLICNISGYNKEDLENYTDSELHDLYKELQELEESPLNDTDMYESIKTFEAFSVPATKKEEKQQEYTILGKEKEPKSNPNFGIGAVKSEEIKTIGSFTDFTKLIDPVTPKERTIGGNAGVFIDNDVVKGYVNRIDGKDVYVESLDEPMVIKKFSLKDAVK